MPNRTPDSPIRNPSFALTYLLLFLIVLGLALLLARNHQHFYFSTHSSSGMSSSDNRINACSPTMPVPEEKKETLVVDGENGEIKNSKKSKVENDVRQLIKPGRRVFSHISPLEPHIASLQDYERLYSESLEEPEEFWGRIGREMISWSTPFSSVISGVFETGDIKWFQDGKLNVAYNCIDRHVEAGHGDRIALLWEGDEPGNNRKITFFQLQEEVSRLSAIISHLQGPSLEESKTPVVTIYMPMIPETVFVMLACARLGFAHNVVFAGFSAESLCDRIIDAQSSVVFTADFGYRGGRKIPLRAVVEEAIISSPELQDIIKKVVTLQREEPKERRESNDAQSPERLDYAQLRKEFESTRYFEPVLVESENPLFLLYTSGSTGKPKGLMHTSGGYLTYASYTARNSFDLHPERGDVFGCLADVGWITGHTYIVYGPLALGATSVLFESIPTYPGPDRYWDTIDRLGITQLYTAPTVIRALRRFGDAPLKDAKLASLRVLGSVGEPINSDAWLWYWKEIGGAGECSVVDTFWQTETGGHVIAPLPAVHSCKPGAAGFPCLGIEIKLLDAVSGEELTGNDVEGVVVISKPWPGAARSIWGDHERFRRTYYSPYPGAYFTGDAGHRDRDGHLWIRGRVDDVINVSGHRLSTAEIEAALGRHVNCAEAAVLGRPDEITGQSIWAFCILKPNGGDGSSHDSVQIRREMSLLVRKAIGPIATPRYIVLTSDLPKTRSGKIMRRLLRKILSGEGDQLGDLSTLNNPAVIEEIKKLVQEADAQLKP